MHDVMKINEKHENGGPAGDRYSSGAALSVHQLHAWNLLFPPGFLLVFSHGFFSHFLRVEIAFDETIFILQLFLCTRTQKLAQRTWSGRRGSEIECTDANILAIACSACTFYGTALGSASGDVLRARGDADGDADTRRSAVPVRAVTEAADDGTASRFALGGRGCDDVDDEVACERGGDGAGTVSDGRGE